MGHNQSGADKSQTLADAFSATPRSDLDLVVDCDNPCHALATTDAQLSFVERAYVSSNRNNTLNGFDFQMAKRGEVLSIQVVQDPPLQVSIGSIKARLWPHHFTPQGLEKLRECESRPPWWAAE